MAQRVHVVLEDDIDGGSADETLSFGLDGATYEIDLSSKNAEKLREVLAPYVGAARRKSRTSARRAGGRSSAATSSSAADVREWARANGYQVSERGRVSAEVRTAYDAAH